MKIAVYLRNGTRQADGGSQILMCPIHLRQFRSWHITVSTLPYFVVGADNKMHVNRVGPTDALTAALGKHFADQLD